jgi:alpha-beta hydrolase superfamily lysophospholipase
VTPLDHAFFGPNDALYGIASGPPDARRAVLVVSPPGADAVRARRVLFRLVRALAAAGHGALLVDPRGSGESALAFEESSFESHVNDVRDGLHELARRFPEAHQRLIAVRYGAIPALAAVEPPAADALLLIDPCLDVRASLRQDLRGEIAERTRRGAPVDGGEARNAMVAQLDAGQAIVVDGERFPPALWRGLNASRPAVLLAAWGERATVLRSGRDTFVAFHRGLPQARVAVEEPAFEAAALAWARA